MALEMTTITVMGDRVWKAELLYYLLILEVTVMTMTGTVKLY